MKHLVLGSEGQIGKGLCDYLLTLGDTIIRFDIKLGDEFDLRIKDNPMLRKCMDDCDFVHFLAFDVGGAKYLEKYQDTEEFKENNLKILRNTFSELSRSSKPFLFASSQMVNMMAHSKYGELKMFGEQLTSQLNGIICRFWNVYGYEEEEEKAHVITDFIKMAKYEGGIKMRTNGDEVRQFLNVWDCAKCLYILSHDYIPHQNKLYDITTYKFTSISQIASIIQNLSGCKVIPSDKTDNIQKGTFTTPNTLILDYWKPLITLKEGIEELYNIY